MNKPFKHVAALVVLALCVIGEGPVMAAEEYPSQPVKVIVAFTPGGTTDILTRLVCNRLSEMWGKSFVVENKPGAGGNIGTAFVVKAPPDGYTLMVNSVGPIAINPTLYKNLNYNPLTDLDPMVQIAEVPNVLVVTPTAKTPTLKDLIAKGKSKQGGLSYGSTGVGTSSHLASYMMAKRDGFPAVHVPYKGADAVVALLGDRIDFMFATIPSVMPHIQSGKLLPIAVSSAKRSAGLPKVPTMIESGYADFEAGSWFGFLGPRGVPKFAVTKLNKAVNDIIKEPAIEKKMIAEGADPIGGSPEKFKDFIASEFKKWREVVKESGATAE